MFVSRKEADARLASEKNLFRDRAAGLSVVIPAIEDSVTQASIEDRDSSDKTPDSPWAVEADEPLLDARQLEALIHPRSATRPYNPYRGREAAQIAIAETTMVLGAGMAGDIFGIHSRQTGAYEEAKPTGRNQHGPGVVNPERKKKLDIVRERLGEKAARKLDMSLEALTDQKIANVKEATDISKIAKDMATVMDKVLPKDEVDGGGIHFHVWRPEFKQTINYDTIEVGVGDLRRAGE